MRPEDRLRARCRMFLNEALPAPAFWSSIEHGQKLSGDKVQRARQWGRLKAQGIKTGLADIFIWWSGKFIGVELKVGDNDTSDAQDDFADAMRDNGFQCHTIRSVIALDELLRQVGMDIPRSMQIAAAGHDAALTQPEKLKKPTRRQAARVVRPKATKASQRFSAFSQRPPT